MKNKQKLQYSILFSTQSVRQCQRKLVTADDGFLNSTSVLFSDVECPSAFLQQDDIAYIMLLFSE